ncbi:ECF transporter S component [Calidifontibacillus erzurumensis]|uniref:ECF transporter S component n=1 Tax=Calidifontibacillus erzurumensis TaxID=2741433 RepID=A0A8J8GER7_9BACI|nr:ECF transporter S component [Calidifontibacillus erzurumensis]NSL50488.1 ECF transporter S component [Calidifontibacillus erzurumensis]
MKIKKLAILALFISFSVVGAMIKIPAMLIGSIALDSFPALVAAVVLGPMSGAIVSSIGHLVSAQLAGFPLGPFHILIAIEMALILLLFGYVYKKGKKLTSYILFFICNGFIAALPFIFILGTGFYVATMPSLVIGTLFNAIAAALVAPKIVAYKKLNAAEKGHV